MTRDDLVRAAALAIAARRGCSPGKLCVSECQCKQLAAVSIEAVVSAIGGDARKA